MVPEPSITINLTHVAICVYIVAKVALAVYLQHRFLTTSQQLEVSPTDKEKWSEFIVNLLFGLEWAVIAVALYPLKVIVLGKKKFFESIFPE
jgi:hypothetical protein